MVKIFGIGNALVDIMTSLESDSLLETLNLPKGSMQIVNDKTIAKALEQTKGLKQSLASGGSAANTINGLANLGMETAFVGKVGNDELGNFFRSDMQKAGISPQLLLGKASTGTALALVSPDSERTFAVNLGAAIEMTAEDITTSLFEGYNYFHIEGYLVQNHSLIEKALKVAKASGLKVSLDLASYNVVESNLDFLQRMVKEYVDIVFANEEEAKAFTLKLPEEALDMLAEIAEIAVVKIGAKGSLIKKGNDKYSVGVVKANAIDTTGAGDLYASGFLYGLSKNLPLDTCGRIGAVLSGKVIEVMGPKMDEETWKMLKVNIAKVETGELSF
ncbi:MAG: adenosine kinase [Tenuifilaceae bacterium]|uniref:adenosine kinase n=1 Tax=Perlabentimonas gracilis TaxID=2715279 RepID=UPI0014074203|nr:adenosine kinase [Perlabentimonas gracilis]MDX9769947.1 adenosine kinase [Tenuifilaceae bacterium]NHB67613.1 adenosine kinase [Perlabentimonas gracilis]